MNESQALRKAIENLIDAKLMDLMGKPGGLDRLLAHRRSGVASFDIRMAERKLEEAIATTLAAGQTETAVETATLIGRAGSVSTSGGRTRHAIAG